MTGAPGRGERGVAMGTIFGAGMEGGGGDVVLPIATFKKRKPKAFFGRLENPVGGGGGPDESGDQMGKRRTPRPSLIRFSWGVSFSKLFARVGGGGTKTETCTEGVLSGLSSVKTQKKPAPRQGGRELWKNTTVTRRGNTKCKAGVKGT